MRELEVQAQILTVDGGRCTFRPAASTREMTLPVDRDVIETVMDDLIDAAVKGEERMLKIRGGIIRAVAPT